MASKDPQQETGTQIQATRIIDGQMITVAETDRAITPFGGMVVFLEFLNKIGFVKKVSEFMPVRHRSPNSIPQYRPLLRF